MKRSVLFAFILVMIAALVPMSVSGESREQALSPEALEISNDLNCPVCEGQSVRDSNSQLARDMRRTVQEMLDEGYTEQEVRDYFVDRYGVGILREPPKSGFFMTLWWAPVIGIGIGALVLGTFLTQRKRSSTKAVSKGAGSSSGRGQADEDDDLSKYEAQLLRELEDDSEWNGRS